MKNGHATPGFAFQRYFTTIVAHVVNASCYENRCCLYSLCHAREGKSACCCFTRFDVVIVTESERVTHARYRPDALDACPAAVLRASFAMIIPSVLRFTCRYFLLHDDIAFVTLHFLFAYAIQIFVTLRNILLAFRPYAHCRSRYLLRHASPLFSRRWLHRPPPRAAAPPQPAACRFMPR